MSICKIFFDELIPLCEHPTSLVDISVLQKINMLSPAKLPLICTDAEKSLSGANETIIKNFALNYGSKGKFSRNAIQAIESMLTKENGHDEHDARKVMMIHISSAALDPKSSALLFLKCAKMTIIRELGDDFVRFRTSAMNVFKNKQVNEIIGSCLQEYGIELKELNTKEYEIVYVSYGSLKLRGFSGINTTYVNQCHFKAAKVIYAGKMNEDLLGLIIEVNIISCVLHEYAHLKLREHINDFNASSPLLAENNQLSSVYFEFGRLVERNVFGEAIDWAESAYMIAPDYLKKVVNAFQTNTNIPKLANLEEISIRESITTVAFDYVVNRYFC